MGTNTMPVGLLRLKWEGKPLTPVERELLLLLGQGYKQVEIAKKLWKSPETIKTQIKFARIKLGAKTTVHAVAIAMAYELI